MKRLRVKNWDQFQHFKDRCPPWIKLYKDLLDDPDWHELSGDQAKVLVMLWLVASEDCGKEGGLPEIKKLAFRLRINEHKLKSYIQQLSHWLIHDDIATISERYQDDAPETETETEGETETDALIPFGEFWDLYPRKQNKASAQKAWKKLKVNQALFEQIQTTLQWQQESRDWQKDGGQFIPYGSTWLNQRRWEDEQPDSQSSFDCEACQYKLHGHCDGGKEQCSNFTPVN